MVEHDRSAGTLELVGGRLCLDYANTMSTRSGAPGREYLTSYDDLVAWSLHAGILEEATAAGLRRWAKGHPDQAVSVLERCLTQREVIYEIFSAVADGKELQQAVLGDLNRAIREAFSRLEISTSEEGFEWRWVLEKVDPVQMVWPIVRSAAELLTSEELGRVRKCGRDGCDWLFVDSSKNQSRRWCSMEICGSRVKSRRYYRRRKRRVRGE
jgi:predicted RNA-binding Zn ribbon-like protein